MDRRIGVGDVARGICPISTLWADERKGRFENLAGLSSPTCRIRRSRSTDLTSTLGGVPVFHAGHCDSPLRQLTRYTAGRWLGHPPTLFAAFAYEYASVQKGSGSEYIEPGREATSQSCLQRTDGSVWGKAEGGNSVLPPCEGWGCSPEPTASSGNKPSCHTVPAGSTLQDLLNG